MAVVSRQACLALPRPAPSSGEAKIIIGKHHSEAGKRRPPTDHNGAPSGRPLLLVLAPHPAWLKLDSLYWIAPNGHFCGQRFIYQRMLSSQCVSGS